MTSLDGKSPDEWEPTPHREMSQDGGPSVVLFDAAVRGRDIHNVDVHSVVRRALRDARVETVALVIPGNASGTVGRGGVSGGVATCIANLAKDVAAGVANAPLLRADGDDDAGALLPVGCAVGFFPIPYQSLFLVYTPTTHRSGADVGETYNAELAAEAAAALCRARGVSRAYMPLFCTGNGGMMPDRALAQMRAGWRVGVTPPAVSGRPLTIAVDVASKGCYTYYISPAHAVTPPFM